MLTRKRLKQINLEREHQSIDGKRTQSSQSSPLSPSLSSLSSPLPSDTANIFTQMSFDQKLKKVSEIWKDFFIEPSVELRAIPKGNTWANEVLVKGKIKCPLLGCVNVFTTKPGLEYHYKRCGITIDHTYRCTFCNYEVQKSQRTIISHLWTCHAESLPTIPVEFVEAIQSLNVSPLIKTKSKDKTNLISTVNLVLEFHEKHYKEKVFPNWIPTIYSWSTLNESERNIYLSNTYSSPFFKSTLNESNNWEQLEMFNYTQSPFHTTFFVGGPVWSCAWCPLPVNIYNFDQFVAISSCMNMDTTHTLNDTELETGVIQIWNMGKLDKTHNSCISPRLALSICHSYGVIWDMDWCAGGTAFEDIRDIKDTEFDLEVLPRLGLLALACGDGYVRIHSIPHPETLPHSYQNFIYRNEQTVALKPPGVGHSVKNEKTICKCVSWIKTMNQKYIAGGYGSGVITVWDLTTTSTLLVVNPSLIRPKYCWIGHSAAVNGIKWMNNGTNYFLASCSFDRSAKLWNLKDLTIPVTTIRKGLFTAIDFHLQWCGIFLTNDDCYLGFQNNVSFKDFGYLNCHINSLTSHKSCIWDLSFSDWLNACASVDAAGEAVIYPNFQIKSDRKSKRKLFDRIPLYHITPKILSEDNSVNNSYDTNIGKENMIERVINSKELPLRSYSDFTAKYGLVFNDFCLNNMNSIPMEEIARIRLPSNMQYQRLSDYPIISINKVCWNPNFNSCTWIMTATQSGVCRISCVSVLDPIKCDTQLNNID